MRFAHRGEFTGYMGMPGAGPYFNVICITYRRNAIYNAFISQFPPSESSKIRGVAEEASLYKFLRYECGLPVLDVALYESSGSYKYCVIRIKKSHPAQAWQVLYGTVAHTSGGGKITIVVDEDIDPRDADSVIWALSFRIMPHRDIRIVPGRLEALDYSAYQPGERQRYPGYPGVTGGSALLIDATRAEVDGVKRENERLKQLVADLSLKVHILKKSEIPGLE